MSEDTKHSKADKAEKKKSRKSVDDGEVKKEKKEKKEKKDKSKDKKDKSKTKDKVAANALLADSKTVDQSLASLFAVKQPPVKAALPQSQSKAVQEVDDDDEEVDDDADLSSIDGDVDLDDEDEEVDEHVEITPAKALAGDATDGAPKRKRKRNAEDELEDAYMKKLSREEEKDAAKAAAERAAKRQRANGGEAVVEEDGEASGKDNSDAEMEDVMTEDDSDAMSPPPKHETQLGPAPDDELLKANRTVFLANVSTEAISSKSSRKALLTHLASFFPDLPKQKSSDTSKPKVESLRFRSTPYAAAIPKKAAYAKKELMDATTKSTNAYAVYSTPALAREACTRLNGTIVLSRHLRVDSVAHPAKIDNHRCIFVGNLGFVDDETNIQDANEEEGREVRKRGKEPADIEEGLWRTFAKCGNVESVRVIRDSTTRVGKGIAYVQFEDENAVEAALQYNEKKFPPMLPRKLRVSRAKAVKRNAKPGSGRPTTNKVRGSSYQRKYTAEEQSSMGRTSKLFGRAAAAKQVKDLPRARGTAANTTPLGESGAGSKRVDVGLGAGIKKPENFIFEGHRARAGSGKAGLKLGGKKKSGTKVTGRSKAFKSKAKAKASGGGK